MPPFDRLTTKQDFVPGAIFTRRSTGTSDITNIITQINRRAAVAGSVGATFIGDDIIDKNSMGAIPCYTARTIISWEVLFLPGVTNGILFDVWKTDYANYDTVSSANTIFSGGIKPYVIAANKNKSLSLAGVDTTINAGDILVFVCISRGTPRWAQISLATQDI